MATLLLDLQLACEDTEHLPNEEDFSLWISQALPEDDAEYEITLRIVDDMESQSLNHQFRGKDKPTNVLSFPFEAPAGITLPLLGDLIICRQIVEQEAIEQKKENHHHWAHMCVHGTLHLRGYDHINADDAEEMESLEVSILHQFSIPNPYLTNE
ncbi:rRNA maturation RNase YbeY [Marinomonas agarivorans]|nr:rRNA maturation RNase YbeY [Marinomonas agarivorans]